MVSGIMPTESVTMMVFFGGNAIQPVGGLRILLDGIRLVSGRRLMDTGTTSMPAVIWHPMNMLTVIG